MGSQVMRSSSAGGQWGREQLSALRGKAISRRSRKIEAMAPGGRIGHEAKRQSLPRASLFKNLNGAGDRSPVLRPGLR